ncbi:MAG: hypothetical protein AAGI52_12925 [Bacteroidota bacterium]
MSDLSIPNASTPVVQPGENLKGLSSADLKSRLDARQRDLTFHVRALGQELGLVADDVVVGERPLLDRVRERPLAALGLALAAGATLGLLWGFGRRARKRPGPDLAADVIRYHSVAFREAAARRVARGAKVEDALAEEARRRPVVFVPADEQPAILEEKSSTRQLIDTALKTAVGIGVKTASDQLTKKLTGHEETFEALQDA